MKRIDYCYVDGSGNEQVGSVSEEGSDKDVGYGIDELTARIWTAVGEGCETLVIPLSRIVFIREVYEVVK